MGGTRAQGPKPSGATQRSAGLGKGLTQASRGLRGDSSSGGSISISSNGPGAAGQAAVHVLGVSSDLGACARVFSSQALQLVRGGGVHYTLMQGQEPHW